MTVQKIVPNLWFNGTAQAAAEFYVSVFPNSRITATTQYPHSAAEGLAKFQLHMADKVLTVDFELNGQPFTAINAGPEFRFSEAVSFAVFCKNQAEIDYYWEKLSAVPQAEQCGWCKDKYGLSWQIVPKNVEELMKKPGAYAVMMQQRKIIIEEYL